MITRSADLFRGVARNGKGIRHWEQIVRVTPVDAAPAQVIGKPWRIGPANQAFEPLQMLAVKLVSRTEINCYAVLDDAVLLKNRVEHFERSAPIDHEILRDDLKPIDDRFFRQNMPRMWHAHANTDAVLSECTAGNCRHDR